jgi:hypothetical protein
MSNPYKANLVGNQLEWVDEVPHLPNGGTSTPVLVTILPSAELTTEEMRRRRIAALERIAARGGVQSIPDPVAWQREMREDRPLPGREE